MNVADAQETAYGHARAHVILVALDIWVLHQEVNRIQVHRRTWRFQQCHVRHVIRHAMGHAVVQHVSEVVIPHAITLVLEDVQVDVKVSVQVDVRVNAQVDAALDAQMAAWDIVPDAQMAVMAVLVHVMDVLITVKVVHLVMMTVVLRAI